MVSIEFQAPELTTGFDIGAICFSGELGPRECFESMVAGSAVLLIDQVFRWVESGAKILEFNPIDSTDFVTLRRRADEVSVWARDRMIGVCRTADLLAEIRRSCRQFYDSSVSQLSEDDPVRGDLELALSRVGSL